PNLEDIAAGNSVTRLCFSFPDNIPHIQHPLYPAKPVSGRPCIRQTRLAIWFIRNVAEEREVIESSRVLTHAIDSCYRNWGTVATSVETLKAPNLHESTVGLPPPLGSSVDARLAFLASHHRRGLAAGAAPVAR